MCGDIVLHCFAVFCGTPLTLWGGFGTEANPEVQKQPGPIQTKKKNPDIPENEAVSGASASESV